VGPLACWDCCLCRFLTAWDALLGCVGWACPSVPFAFFSTGQAFGTHFGLDYGSMFIYRCLNRIREGQADYLAVFTMLKAPPCRGLGLQKGDHGCNQKPQIRTRGRLVVVFFVLESRACLGLLDFVCLAFDRPREKDNWAGLRAWGRCRSPGCFGRLLAARETFSRF